MCGNRSVRSKQHSIAGGPEDWFTDNLLSNQGYKGISFDFFVNWKLYELSPEIWIKRVVADKYQPWPEYHTEAIQQALASCDGTSTLETLAQFFLRYRLTLYYQLFKESVDWRRHPSPIVTVTIENTGSISLVEETPLPTLKSRIQLLSGGPVAIGSKGLIYGTTTLECYLSRTDAAWPGDVDMIIVDGSGGAVAILEFKKHTLNSPIEEQALSNYYPSPDGRKYDRMAVLRDHLSPDVPIVILYYPTQTQIHSLKLELIAGKRGKLGALQSRLVPLPTKHDTKAHQQLFETILKMVNR
jgi:hypothetical protein